MRSSALMLTAVAVAASVAVGCGGSDDDSSAQTTPQAPTITAPPAGEPRGRFAGLAACLREQGIEPKSLRGGPPDEAAMAALEACRDAVPEGAIPNLPPGQGGVPD